MAPSRPLTHEQIRRLLSRLIAVGHLTERIQQHLERRGYGRRDPMFRELYTLNVCLGRLKVAVLRLGMEQHKDDEPGWAELARRKDKDDPKA